MDQLTKGMKKIKINLVTQSQKEAREKARLASTPTIESPIDDQGSITVNSASTLHPMEAAQSPIVYGLDTIESDKIAPLKSFAGDPALPELLRADSGTPVTPVRDVTHNFSTPGADQMMSSPLVGASTYMDQGNEPTVFIPYQPEGPEPTVVHRQEPLQWLPPNAPPSNVNTPAATPSPIKSNLYHHTPGAIPFAPRGPNSISKQNLGFQSNGNGVFAKPLQDIPETPSKQKQQAFASESDEQST